MADLELPHTIDANTTADAGEVEQNFNEIKTHINEQLISSDGSVSMLNPLELSGDPTEDNQAANKGYVDDAIPVGTILPFAGASSPGPHWHLCDGAELSSSTYPVLSGILEETYGSAGTNMFRLPNLQGRIPIGANTGSTGGRFDLGRTSGSWLVPVPSHTHGLAHDHAEFTSGGQSAVHTHANAHDHDIDHDHAGFIATALSAGSQHDHTVRTRTGALPAAGPLKFVVEGSDANFNGTGAISNGGADTGGHTHDVGVNLALTVGLETGPSSDPTTDNNSVGHTHLVNVPAITNSVQSQAFEKEITYDTVPTDDLKSTVELIPPHVSINFIIKLDPL